MRELFKLGGIYANSSENRDLIASIIKKEGYAIAYDGEYDAVVMEEREVDNEETSKDR